MDQNIQNFQTDWNVSKNDDFFNILSWVFIYFYCISILKIHIYLEFNDFKFEIDGRTDGQQYSLKLE